MSFKVEIIGFKSEDCRPLSDSVNFFVFKIYDGYQVEIDK
jgi:hypothetical protein